MLVRRTSVRSLSQATSLQNKSKLYSFQVRKLWTSKVPAPRSLEGKSSHLKTYRKRDVNALVNTRHVVQQLSEGIVALRQGGWSGTETIFARTLLLQRAKALESILSTVVTPAELDWNHLPKQVAEASKEELLEIAAALRDECLHGLGDMPLCRLNEGQLAFYPRLLREYDEARKSPSQIKKLNYVKLLRKSVLPHLWDDLSYFQAMSMLLSYLHVEVDDLTLRIPFTPHTFSVIGQQHRSVLVNTKELELCDWLLQTGGRHSGVKLKFWKGIDGSGRDTGVYVVDAMGTNSMGPNRDSIYGKLGVVTGSLADADPGGIAAWAYGEMEPIVRRKLAGIPKEALVVNIGHSLGASVAVRTYLTQQEMGYENAYVIGYNGGAISDPVSDEILQHAIEHVVFVHNRRDWVQYGGKHLLPGALYEYEFTYDGTIGPWNVLWGKSRDPIFHGDMQHLAGVLVGAPAKFTISDSANLRTGALRSFNHMLTQWCPGVWGGLITGVLKPDPEEYARKALSYRTRSQFAKPSKIW